MATPTPEETARQFGRAWVRLWDLVGRWRMAPPLHPEHELAGLLMDLPDEMQAAAQAALCPWCFAVVGRLRAHIAREGD